MRKTGAKKLTNGLEKDDPLWFVQGIKIWPDYEM